MERTNFREALSNDILINSVHIHLGTYHGIDCVMLDGEKK